MNISSVVVTSLPENVEEVKASIEKINECEFHVSDENGRMIFTIESEGVETEMAILTQMQKTDKVISAEMHFSYSEDELDSLREDIEKHNSVPEWLNDDTPAERIKYQGDLKKKRY